MLVNGKLVEKLDSKPQAGDFEPSKRHVFIIGSKGIPAAYGGFETFVEKLTEYQKSDDIQYHVSRMGDDFLRYKYNNAICFNVKVPELGSGKAVYYDVLALKKAIDLCKAHPEIKNPVFYILACRIGPFMAHFKKEIQSIGGILLLNPDGHEWLRAKWSKPIQLYWKQSEKMMVEQSDLVICDSENIQEYIRKRYSRFSPSATFIAYGSDVTPSKLKDDDPEYLKWMDKHDVRPDEYYLVVGRFVPENNYETMIREFMKSSTKKDFIIITNNQNKFLYDLERRLHFQSDPRIKFVGTVYDQELLKKIRENAFAYFHGHEVGGTNPSLLEALSSTKLNLLLNVGFNQEVARNGALYWTKDNGSLCSLMEEAEQLSSEEIASLSEKAKRRISNYYSWPYITKLYEQLFLEYK